MLSLYVLCRQWNRKTPEDQARKTYDRALKLENEFTEFFTGLYLLTHLCIVWYLYCLLMMYCLMFVLFVLFTDDVLFGICIVY